MTTEAAAPRGWTVKSTYTLAILTMIYIVNFADRQMLGLVLPLIKEEMKLDDVTLGLLTGFVFVLFYSILGVPIARLADRSNRRNILGIGLAFWSAMTVLTGAVTNLWQMVVTRFLMGAGEAAGIAPSTSMISDLFDKARRPLAMGIFTAGSGLAVLLFFPVIGWIAQNHGWRICFVIAGGLGLILTLLLFFTVQEPKREGLAENAKVKQESAAVTARFLFGSPAYLCTIAGGAFIGVSLYAAAVWHPSFLARVHKLNMAEIGVAIGIFRGLASVGGAILGGFLATYLGKGDDRWRLWLPGIVCVAALPAELIFLLHPSLPVSLAGMMVFHLFLGMHFGPVYAACQTLARPTMRATATAVFLLSANLVGQIIGPLAVGYLNELWSHLYGLEAIRYSLILGGACAALGGVLLLLGANTLRRDTARAEAS